MMRRAWPLPAVVFLGLGSWFFGCGSSSDAAPTGTADGDAGADATTSPDASDADAAPAEIPGTQIVNDLAADLTASGRFFDLPWPSDLRLAANGAPDFTGFPDPAKSVVIESFESVAGERKGFPQVPVAYFRLTAKLADRSWRDVVAADAKSPLLLVDVDPASPERGKLFPVVAQTVATDPYAPDFTLALAARPGVILHPKRKYAFVVRRSLDDAAGTALGVPLSTARLLAGVAPDGAKGGDAATLWAPLLDTLDTLGVARADVAGATVFTTGDVVGALAALSDAIVAKYDVSITGLAYDDNAGAGYDGFCRVNASVTYPRFQKGTPPYDTDGRFVYGADGLPEKQADDVAPVVLTFPAKPMPAKGYPLMMYFHGSGGSPVDDVDRGTILVVDGPTTPGQGPAWVVAPYGIATAASALPLNPERVPGASDYAYLNLKNLAAFPYTFQQGVLEQRLFIEALKSLAIPASVLASCAGATLPTGATAFQFDPDLLVAQGQSMGGMYTNMIGALEPRIKAVVPTGAGGYWSMQLIETTVFPGLTTLVSLAIGSPNAQLTFAHPALHLLETAWEPAEPFVYMGRLGADPLPGHPARSVYEPVGKDDPDFPLDVYDGAALAYRHPEAGDVKWPSMQDALKLEGLDGIASYPVADDRTSTTGAKYTSAVVQFLGDGIASAHDICSQSPEFKHQAACFLDSFVRTGKAVIVAPNGVGTPCQ